MDHDCERHVGLMDRRWRCYICGKINVKWEILKADALATAKRKPPEVWSKEEWEAARADYEAGQRRMEAVEDPGDMLTSDGLGA